MADEFLWCLMLLFHSRVLFPFCFALQWDGGIGEDWMPAPPPSPPPPFPNPVSGEWCGQVTSDKVTKHISRQKKHSETTNVFHVTGWQTKKTSPAALSLHCVVESVGLHVGPSDCPLDSWDWDGQIQDWLGLLLGSLALRLCSFYLNPCTRDDFSSPNIPIFTISDMPNAHSPDPHCWWQQPHYLCPTPNFLTTLALLYGPPSIPTPSAHTPTNL